MLLNEILKEMNEKCEFIGDMSFETLAYSNSSIEARVLVFIDDPKYITSLPSNSVVLTTSEIAPSIDGCDVCLFEKPRLLFAKIHNFLAGNERYVRKCLTTQIGDNCRISPLAYIAENNVRIGYNAVIEEFVSIKENTVIGDNCVIRAGSIIGGEGFEAKRDGDKTLSVKHYGGVVIGDNVEIQQLCVVDKAVFPWDDTKIGDYCKMDNHIHIAHGVKMGTGVFIAAGLITGGQIVMGNDIWIGPNSTITNSITVGSNARVNIGAVATKSISDNESVTGNFAIEHSQFIRNLKRSLEYE